MINYSASPFCHPHGESNICHLFKAHQLNSQGIKSQTHYGFMFPFERLSTPGVYKSRGWQILKEKVIFTFTCRSSTNVRSKMSSLSCVSPENRYQLADEDIQYTVLSPFHFHTIPTTRCTNLELFSKSSYLYSFVLSMECVYMFIHYFYYAFNGVFPQDLLLVILILLLRHLETQFENPLERLT